MYGRYVSSSLGTHEKKGRLFSCSNCGQNVSTRWSGQWNNTEICGHCGIEVLQESKQRMQDRDRIDRIERWVRELHDREVNRRPVKDRAKIRRGRIRALTK